MPVNLKEYYKVREITDAAGAVLVAVSKIKPIADILELYEAGQRDFGENYVQEMIGKQQLLPPDIRWHFIGHLQSNKVKYIASQVHLIHGVDSLKLLQSIQKEGAKINRRIQCLLQVHVAQEETKFGLSREDVSLLLEQWNFSENQHVSIRGLMGMASFTDDQNQLKIEFHELKTIFEETRLKFFMNSNDFDTLSMGMSGDYTIALAEGSTMVRIGSLLFGARS